MNLDQLKIEKRKQECNDAVGSAFPGFKFVKNKNYASDTGQITICIESELANIELNTYLLPFNCLDFSSREFCFNLFRKKGYNLRVKLNFLPYSQTTIQLNVNSKQEALKRIISCNFSPMKPHYFDLDKTIQLYRNIADLALADCSYSCNDKKYFDTLTDWHEDLK